MHMNSLHSFQQFASNNENLNFIFARESVELQVLIEQLRENLPIKCKLRGWEMKMFELNFENFFCALFK